MSNRQKHLPIEIMLGMLAIGLVTGLPSLGLATQDLDNEQGFFRLQVLDVNEQPADGAKLDFVGLDPGSTKMLPTRTDELGGAFVEIKDFYKQTFYVAASTDDQQAGFSRVYGLRIKPKEIVTIKLQEKESITAVVTDFDTGVPIANCDVEFWCDANNKHRFHTKSLVTDREGRLAISGLTPNLYGRFKVTCPGYHDFDNAASYNYSLHKRNGVTQTLEIQLLSEASYQKIIKEAKSIIADVTQLSPAESIKAITQQYATLLSRKQNQNRLGQSISPARYFIRKMQTPVIGHFRNKIWELTNQLPPSSDEHFEALLWLANNCDDDSTLVKSVTNHEVAAAMVDDCFKHPRISECLSNIRSFHQEPQAALEKIVRVHPEPRTQALALSQLVFLKSIRFGRFSYGYVLPANPEIEQRQERAYLEQLLQNYSHIDIKIGSPVSTWVDESIKLLNRFGVGGSPPVLTGREINGNKQLSLADFSKQVIVLHYINQRPSADFADLKAIADQYGDQVQVIGIVKGYKESSIRFLKNYGITWPVLWGEDCPSLIVQRFESGPKKEKLMWGKQIANHFEVYSTIVIDQAGKIRAVGLRNKLLNKCVDDLLLD